MTMDVIGQWIGRLELQGKSKRTAESYGAEVRRLAAWGAPAELRTLTAAQLEQYLLERMRSGLGPSGIAVAVCAFRSLYKFLGLETAQGLRAPVARPRLQRTLAYQEAEAVVASLDTSTLEGKRDLALIGLIIASGLRASEVARVRVEDVDLAGGFFSVLVKGGQIELGVFDAEAGAALASWLAVRSLVAQPGVETVFVSLARAAAQRGRPLTRQGVKLICKRLAVRAGVKHFSPHALRRYFATDATENGCPSRLLMSAGRWKQLGQLEQYARASRLKAFVRFSPFARLMGGGG